jgi:endonuclease/exonuclease/phosphatase family metal-dependent hydrolase
MIRLLFKNIFRTMSVLLIVATGLSYLSPWVHPGRFGWLTFFGTAFPWWVLLNLLMAGFWLVRWSRYAIYHIVMLAAGWTYITCFWGLNGLGSLPALPEQHVTIATHNLGGMFRYTKGDLATAVARKAALYADFLKKNGNPDILCTQETRADFYKELATLMDYKHVFNLKKGTVILSRLPLEAGGDIPFGDTHNSTLWVQAILPDGQTVRLYNVHLQSNKVTNDAERVIENGQLDDQGTWRKILGMLRRVDGATHVRTDQAERLRKHMLACPHPVVVCGDFNDTPNSYVYRHVSEGLTDTYQAVGRGVGTTFAGVLPMLRIDYVLTDPKFRPVRCVIERNNEWSDHYPVVVTLGL